MSNSSNVPDDMCKSLYGCNSNECPTYKEYIETSVSSGVVGSREQQAQLKQLQQAAICVEKFQSAASKKLENSSPFQRAAFLMSTLWNTNQVLKVSFMPLPSTYPGMQPQWDGSTKQPQTNRNLSRQPLSDSEDTMPLWYTKDTVMTNKQPGQTLSAADEELERKVREMDPVDAIRYIITERIQPLVGLNFEWVESDDGDIRIKLDNREGAWSYVGNQSKQIPMNQQTMNFGWLDVSTIIHEFCHALGMIHEHQNPYGKGIDWNLKKLYSWALATQGWDLYTTCQNITKKYSTDQVNGSEYDPKSIMLYSYPAWLTNNKVGTYRNIVLSETDKNWLSAIYPKSGPRKTPQELNTMRQNSSGSDSSDATWAIVLLIVVIVTVLLYFGYNYYKKRQRQQYTQPQMLYY
jgi:hypothetical protein